MYKYNNNIKKTSTKNMTKKSFKRIEIL